MATQTKGETMTTGYYQYERADESVRVYVDKGAFRRDRQELRENGWRPLDLTDGRYARTPITTHYSGTSTPVFSKRYSS